MAVTIIGFAHAVCDLAKLHPFPSGADILQANGRLNQVCSFTIPQFTAIKMKSTSAVLCLVSFFLLHDRANAQIDIKPVEIEGTIVALAPNSITIRQGDRTLVADISTVRRLPGGGILEMAPPTILVRGQQSTDMLQRGMLVRFEADVERFRRLKDSVKDITVFSRGEFTELGFLAPHADLPAVADVGVDDPDKAKNAKADPVQRFLVAGIVDSARPGKFIVVVPSPDGEKKLTVNFADDAVLNLELTDISLAKVGNKIKASGETIRLPHFFAAEVEVFIDPDKKLLAQQKAREGNAAEREIAKAGPFDAAQPAEDIKKKTEEADLAKAGNALDPAPKAEDPVPAAKPQIGGAAKPVDDENRLLPDGRRKRGLRGRVIKIN